LINKRKLDY